MSVDLTQLKFAAWALEQVKARMPSNDMAQPKLQALIDALAALREKPGAQVFGMSLERIEPAGRATVEERVVATLVAWKRHFETASDTVALTALDGVGQTFALSELCLTGRIALRCDPLGTRDGLSAAWLARLDRLAEVKAGTRTLDLDAIHFVGEADPPEHRMRVGEPNLKTIYDYALRYEATTGTAFPRELAAMWAIVNGISVDGTSVLNPINACGFTSGGLAIGAAHDDGLLIIEAKLPERPLMTGAVIDLDDQFKERARYPDFGAYLDTLLGHD